jgi:hypothetical protein
MLHGLVNFFSWDFSFNHHKLYFLRIKNEKEHLVCDGPGKKTYLKNHPLPPAFLDFVSFTPRFWRAWMKKILVLLAHTIVMQLQHCSMFCLH